ncbi:MAG: ribonucleoside-diphosphate reductase subunit alpha [Puniceicoccales bacterium]|jgi:ribonucleoside-diphosphate reductase alpha chain|nr:ribonucleoside-diphosphate reductase subunit alpha [Puniceicoccales bacterium]
MEIRVLRRNRQLVPWRREKIAIAVGKAFLAAGRLADPADGVAERVEQKIFLRGLASVDIESIQDAVQAELLAMGERAIAESYAAYRRSRDGERKRRELLQTLPQQAITFIRMADGNVRCWTDGLWLGRLRAAAEGLDLEEPLEQILQRMRHGLPDELTWEELRRATLSNVLRRATGDPAFSQLAARLDLQFLREDVLGHADPIAEEDVLRRQRRLAFPPFIRRAVAAKLLDERLEKFDLAALAEALDGDLDRSLDWPAMELLRGELLLREKGRILETPQFFWMRVAMGIFWEDAGKSLERVLDLYGAMARREFCPASTTLLYAGTPNPKLLPSYTYELRDTMADIMGRGIAENAFAARWGAGLGGSWTAVRGAGAPIGGSGGISAGVRPFLELHRHQLAIAHQGPHRRAGAGCAYLDIWHRDVPMFLGLWKEMAIGSGMRREPELQTCLWIPDIFMERLGEGDGRWTFFQPGDVPDLFQLNGQAFSDRYRAYEAAAQAGEIFSESTAIQEFWQRLLAHIFETGYPRLAFADTFQKNHLGRRDGHIRTSSLFGETAMALDPGEGAGCAFGTISLPAHGSATGDFDGEAFCRSVRRAVRTLDTVLSVTQHPAPSFARHCERNRGLALGLAGLHDLLRRQGLPFDSEEAERRAAAIGELLCREAIRASVELAEERGACPVFPETRWAQGVLPPDLAGTIPSPSPDWDGLRSRVRKSGMRNAYLIAHAPTSRTARLLGVSAGVLALESNVHRIALPDGEKIWVLDAPLAEVMKDAGLWTGEIGERLNYLDGDLESFPELPEALRRVFAPAFSLSAEGQLAVAASLQAQMDQSQFFPLRLRMPTFSLLSQLLQSAWRRGIKVIGQLVTAHALVHGRARANFIP